jgi:hypothetical protein
VDELRIDEAKLYLQLPWWGVGGVREVRRLRKMQQFLSTNKYQTLRDNQIYKRAVSHAVRPLSVARCVSTGRIAQLRRGLLLTHITLYSFFLACAHPRTLATRYPRVARIMPFLAGISGAVVLFLAVMLSFWPALLMYWPVLVLLAFFCIVTTFFITRALLNEKPERGYSSTIYTALDVHGHGAHFVGEPPATYVPVSESNFSLPLPSLPHALFSSSHGEVNTPMPVPPTPLVRVLETIDLSSTNVEHFLTIKPDASLGPTLDIKEQSTPLPQSESNP